MVEVERWTLVSLSLKRLRFCKQRLWFLRRSFKLISNILKFYFEVLKTLLQSSTEIISVSRTTDLPLSSHGQIFYAFVDSSLSPRKKTLR